ncbi:6751_t:CDS:2 [Acaulospora morrowiae]|uniref:2-dehydropantoate 2-reductase n=1 Tax=Acaulospora morrowiae TaxID=94023 RepID=A0A9N9FS80_9GLOM|nr:6751_t:CDS:2 [Acaulospora morrowiae]
MKFHILAAGTLGNLIAHYLRKNKHSVTLLLRTPVSLSQFERRQRTITVVQQNGDTEQSKEYEAEVLRGFDVDDLVDQHFFYGTCPPNLQIQRLIVTTKAQDVKRAFQRIFYRLSPESTIVLLTNGMGIYEELMVNFFSQDEKLRPNILMGASTHLAYRTKELGSSYNLMHYGIGEIDLGIIPRREDSDQKVAPSKDNNDNSEIESTFQEEHLEAESKDSIIDDDIDQLPYIPQNSLRTTLEALTNIPELHCRHINVLSIQNRLLENLVINACINPLTTIFSIRNGGLLFNPGADRVMQAICQESSQVMQRHREFLGMRPSNRFGPNRIVDAVQQICKSTMNYKSTMLQDVIKRNVTEIDYLNGYLVRLGKFYGIPTPVNQFVVDMVPKE